MIALHRRLWLVAGLVVALAASRHFALGTFSISGDSMVPALRDGDHIAVNRLAYLVHDPAPGEVVVFDRPASSLGSSTVTLLVKRVVAIPGDRVSLRPDGVWVNGRHLPDTETVTGRVTLAMDAIVAPGRVFVLGDNRPRSQDSRTFGTIPVTAINGRAEAIVWPPSDWGGL